MLKRTKAVPDTKAHRPERNFSDPIITFLLFYGPCKGPEFVIQPARGQDSIENLGLLHLLPFFSVTRVVGISLYQGQNLLIKSDAMICNNNKASFSL